MPANPHEFSRLDPYQRIVRVEDLSRPLFQFGITYDDLNSAFLNKNYPLLDKFLDNWNSIRDLRPAFAAWRDELQIELEAEDWPDLLRDRLGLAHYTCVTGPTPVALMEYRVRDVIGAGALMNLTTALTAPTVLDCKPWPYFFPAPTELSCGRTMPLAYLHDDNQLIAELLHCRLNYSREHLNRLGLVKRLVPRLDLRKLRNLHLLSLQIASDRESFGEEIV